MNFWKMSGNFPGENFRGKNSGKFREIPGNFLSGKFPGEISGEIPGKFIFLSAEFLATLQIG